MKASSSNPVLFEGILRQCLVEFDLEFTSRAILVKDKLSGALLNQLDLNKEDWDLDIQAVKAYEEGIVLTDNSIVFLLVDSGNELNSRVVGVGGGFRGTVQRLESQFALQLVSAQQIVVAGRATSVQRLDEIFRSDLAVCEILFPDPAFSPSDREIEILINSVIMEMSFHNGIVLHFPGQKYTRPSVATASAPLEILLPTDIEPILFFNSGEALQFPHLRYLEYYHVLEYFFYEERTQQMNDLIGQVIAMRLQKKGSLSNPDYFAQLARLSGEYFAKSSDTEEAYLKVVMKRDLPFEMAYQLLSELGPKVESLGKAFLGDQTTCMEITPFYDKSRKVMRSLEEITVEQRDATVESIAKRIYRVRNYIVHTKKGEKSVVYKPQKVHFESLSTDLDFVRSISHLVIQKHAISD